MIKKIKYDLKAAYDAGVQIHPQIYVASLGIKALSYEANRTLECVYMVVENIPDELPKFITDAEPNYLLFTYDDYYPAGGLTDLVGDFHSLEEIVDNLNRYKAENFDVLDLATLKNVNFMIHQSEYGGYYLADETNHSQQPAQDAP